MNQRLMDWQTFTLSLVETLAWPITLVLILALFRTRLGEMLENLYRRIARAKASVPGGAFDIQFTDEIYDATREAQITGTIESESVQPNYDSDGDFLLQLARTRASGVKLRNDGIRLTTETEINEWLRDVQRWHDNSKQLITRVSPVEAEIYETLDWIEAPDFREVVNADHRFVLRVLSHRLKIVREIVTRHLG
ncbi:MAG: hypothetical protein O6949_12930 [Chloroflexi bacterium]|nr:hypothetical protein [Chloroflexota bacterium]